jgi:hypothetical protein
MRVVIFDQDIQDFQDLTEEKVITQVHTPKSSGTSFGSPFGGTELGRGL